MKQFSELGLSDRTLKAITQKGFEEPTQIQELTIPAMLSQDDDIVAQAQTGTGKTAAFGLPLIELIDCAKTGVKALIIAPTRELVVQICEELNSLKGENPLKIAPIYGGQSYDRQIYQLKRGIDIVVGSPGRILDHVHRGTLDLSQINSLVMDEADEMLNMGFIEDIEEIISVSNPQKRMLLFSATMPQRIRELADSYLKNPITLKTKTQLTTNLTDQIYFEVFERDRFEALCRIIDMEDDFYAIVFCRTKIETDEIASHLIDRGYSADALHGDISQFLRERILTKFRKKAINVLVATDVAARGIDVSDLTHVINYSLPQNPEAYVHRIGRTGRAGQKGTAITFVTPSEFRKLGFLQRATKADIKKREIPTVPEIMAEQKRKISKEIELISNDEDSEEFEEWARELLVNYNPEKLVSVLISAAYGDKFDTENYTELTPVKQKNDYRKNAEKRGGFDKSDKFTKRKSNDGFDEWKNRRFDKKQNRDNRFVEQEGTTRLFIAKGKNDDFNKKKAISMITEVAGKNVSIGTITIHDSFSFVNVPFAAAEIILRSFNGSKDTVVKRAKSK
ncbi:MAG: DEAD/DEAH box helicase [Chitinispirillales bacterium]|jgi:ATP-dependent RNA helicase DeaD|nr:DEAD/DEAH box helicase [Chitinispirillales bacterium]